MIISMGAPDRARRPSPCHNASNQRPLFCFSFTAVPSHCNETPRYRPSAVRYVRLALYTRELLVSVFGGIAQPPFGHTRNAPAPLVGVGQLLLKNRLQFADDPISPRIQKLFRLLDARCILGIECIGFLQKVVDNYRFTRRKRLG